VTPKVNPFVAEPEPEEPAESVVQDVEIVVEEPKPEAKPKGNVKAHAEKIADAFEAMTKEVAP
jgi:hypothetical protein